MKEDRNNTSIKDKKRGRISSSEGVREMYGPKGRRGGSSAKKRGEHGQFSII